MTIDGLTLHFVAAELNETVTGCKVDKVHQPRPDTVVLSLRAPGKNLRLLICAGAFDSRMHLAENKPQNPKKPPMFCMFLRKHITGAKIVSAKQHGLERIVNIRLEGSDELGISRSMTLVAELMGKYSNVILLGEDGMVMDSLRHVTRSVSRVRTVMPQGEYVLPPSAKLDLLNVSHATLVEMLNKRGDQKMKPYLSKILQGVSGPTAEEILFRYMPGGYSPQPKEAERIAEVVLRFVEALKTPAPTLYLRDKNTPFFYSPVPYQSLGACERQTFSAANTMVDRFYTEVSAAAAVAHRRAALLRQTGKMLEKHSRILEKQHEALEKAKKADQYRRWGDIITANIYRIARGADVLHAQDFETGEDVSIPLDTRLSPAANAQKNYRKYNKRKAGKEITAKRMAKSRQDIAFLESVAQSLETCDTLHELEEIDYELAKSGMLKARSASKAKPTQAPSTPLRFTSSDGIAILAGKNNRQNDTLTMKMAEPDDVWLHTQKIPGSHVLIRTGGRPVPDATLHEAAVIAATLSKAKGALKVPVDYAPRKNIRKPNGAKPGMVVYDGYNTVIVDPDPALLKRLSTQ